MYFREKLVRHQTVLLLCFLQSVNETVNFLLGIICIRVYSKEIRLVAILSRDVLCIENLVHPIQVFIQKRFAKGKKRVPTLKKKKIVKKSILYIEENSYVILTGECRSVGCDTRYCATDNIFVNGSNR